MPTKLEKLETALVNAHSAGDVDAAKKLANEIKRIKQEEVALKKLDNVVNTKTDLKTTAKDVLRSGLAGATRLPAYVAGLPGDINELGKLFLPDYMTAPVGELITGKPKKNIFPTSQQIIDYTENKLPQIKPVTSYVPKTKEGKYAKTITEFALPGLAGKSKVLTTGIGAGGGLMYQGLEDLTQSPLAATGVTIPAMMAAGFLGGPSTAASLAERALKGVDKKQIDDAIKLEKTADELGIKLLPGETFDDKFVQQLTEGVVKSETGSPLIYEATKTRADDITNLANKQANIIANAPQSQRAVFDIIQDTGKDALQTAKNIRASKAQKAGYGVANNEALDPGQVLKIINTIDNAIANTNNVTNRQTLNKIKNELIKKRVKVKGKKKKQIIPETNINKLDGTFKIYRDNYRNSTKGKNTDLFINTDLGGKLFNQDKNGILDVLNAELRTNKNYAKANDTFAQLSDEIVSVVEKNIEPLIKNNLTLPKIERFIFNPSQASVDDINKTLATLNKTNPEATIEIANIYFRNKLNKAFPITKQGEDLTQGFNLVKSIVGEKGARDNFMAVLDNVAKAKNVNPKDLKVGFEKMIKVLERTAKISSINKPGFDVQGIAQKTLVKDAAMMKTFNPFVRLATKYGEMKAGGANKVLGRIFASDQAVQNLVDLARTNPQSKKAVLNTLYILDGSQGLQSQPLTTDEERLLYLERLSNQ